MHGQHITITALHKSLPCLHSYLLHIYFRSTFKVELIRSIQYCIRILYNVFSNVCEYFLKKCIQYSVLYSLNLKVICILLNTFQCIRPQVWSVIIKGFYTDLIISYSII